MALLAHHGMRILNSSLGYDRHREDREPTWPENARDLADGLPVLLNMLEDVAGNDGAKPAIGEEEPGDVAAGMVDREWVAMSAV